MKNTDSLSSADSPLMKLFCQYMKWKKMVSYCYYCEADQSVFWCCDVFFSSAVGFSTVAINYVIEPTAKKKQVSVLTCCAAFRNTAPHRKTQTPALLFVCSFKKQIWNKKQKKNLNLFTKMEQAKQTVQIQSTWSWIVHVKNGFHRQIFN